MRRSSECLLWLRLRDIVGQLEENKGIQDVAQSGTDRKWWGTLWGEAEVLERKDQKGWL